MVGDEEHGHRHQHGLTRSEELGTVSDRRLLAAVALNHLLTVAEVIAGFLSGSIALLSDAAHNFNDANALLIAYVARRIARKEASEQYTFGYRRAELIGALINLTLLAVIGLYLIYQAIRHWIEPEPITGWLMAAAAAVALVVDLATAVLLWAMSRGSLNVRAAFVHNLVDALGSLGVLLGAAAVIYLDWNWIDPLLTLGIAGYILWQVISMLPNAVQILMEGAPTGFDLPELVQRLESLDGIREIHHVHVWELDEHSRALEAHLVVEFGDLSEVALVKRQIKQILAEEFRIGHSTLEFELPEETGCDDEAIITPH